MPDLEGLGSHRPTGLSLRATVSIGARTRASMGAHVRARARAHTAQIHTVQPCRLDRTVEPFRLRVMPASYDGRRRRQQDLAERGLPGKDSGRERNGGRVDLLHSPSAACARRSPAACGRPPAADTLEKSFSLSLALPLCVCWGEGGASERYIKTRVGGGREETREETDALTEREGIGERERVRQDRKTERQTEKVREERREETAALREG